MYNSQTSGENERYFNSRPKDKDFISGANYMTSRKRKSGREMTPVKLI
jgi:hypothetical protein